METSTLTIRATSAATSITKRIPSPAGPLAKPPPGSGLKPVMGEPGLPFIGHSLNVINDGLPFSRRMYERYGPVGWFGGFGIKTVFVLGPDAIEEVLTNRDRAFANKEGWEYFIGPFFHRGVMLMDFEEHKHHRRIMQQGFKRERLVGYLDSINPAVERGVAAWEPGDFHLYSRTKELTLDVGTEVFVGAELGPEADELNEAFCHAVVAGTAIVRADMPGGRWRRGLQSRRYLEDYFRRQLPAKRASDDGSMFSVLCNAETEEGERFSDEDVVSHMIFLLMAAHDTSTLSVSFMGYFLGLYPEWQERLREECVGLGKDHIGYDDLDELPVMDMVFKETLRMYAPVGILFRKAIKETSIQGHYLPQGSQIALAIYPTQRMEPWWSNPDVFDPERFSDERREDQSHKYAWTPFGGNVHKCIGMHFGGMEVKAIMHQMVRRFSWTVPADYVPPITAGTGPTPADGLPIQLRRL